MPEILDLTKLLDRRMWRTEGQVTTVALPWDIYPNGRTVGCMRPVGDVWSVRIYIGVRKGLYTAATEEAARRLLDRHTEGLVLR